MGVLGVFAVLLALARGTDYGTACGCDITTGTANYGAGGVDNGNVNTINIANCAVDTCDCNGGLFIPATGWALGRTLGCFCGDYIGPATCSTRNQFLASEYAPAGLEVATFQGWTWEGAGSNNGYTLHCNGGCLGNVFKSYIAGQYVTKISVWKGDVCWGSTIQNIQKMCWTFSGGDVECVGGNRDGCATPLGETLSYEFGVGETLNSLHIGSGSNGDGTDKNNVSYLKFTTEKSDGSQSSFDFGYSDAASTTVDLYGMNVAGKEIFGFFGKADNDLNQLGVFVATAECTVTKREITGVTCKTADAGNCLSTWTSSGKMIGVTGMCKTCGVLPNDPDQTCDFTFSYTSTTTQTTTSTSITEISGGGSATIGFSADFGENLLFEASKATFSASATISFGVSHTWENSKSTSHTVSGTTSSGCDATVPPGQIFNAKGLMKTGTLSADLVMTVTEWTSCGGKTATPHDATVTVDNVPGLDSVSGCTFSASLCPSRARVAQVQ